MAQNVGGHQGTLTIDEAAYIKGTHLEMFSRFSM